MLQWLQKWLLHNRNMRFNALFFRNLRILILGITLPLIVAELTLYAFSQNTLSRELDAANMRALNKVQSIMDLIVEETTSISLRISIDPSVQSFLSLPQAPYSDYRSIEMAQRSIYTMQISQRLNIDHSITLYSGLHDYILHTDSGSQRLATFSDRQCIELYRDEMGYEEQIWYALRTARSSSDPALQPAPVITQYRRIMAMDPRQIDFVAVNLDIGRLNALIGSVRQDDNSDLVVVDKTGRILISSQHQDLALPLADYLADTASAEQIRQTAQGALHLDLAGQKMRLSWMDSTVLDWTYIQIIPYSTFAANSRNLLNFLILTILIGVFISVVVSFGISVRVFRPIGAILTMMDDPRPVGRLDDYDGEVRSILMNILEAYQKNITLEDQMVQRLSLLKSARVRALQHQMTPHFLYNTLQAINWLVVMETGKEDSRSSQTIVTLAELVRTCMEFGDSLSTVGDELDYVGKYLEIQMIRFSDQIKAQIDAPESLLGCSMPRISLQPLIENAILHGIQKRKGVGSILIKIRQEESKLVVTVDDDGPGMSQVQLDEYNEAFRAEYMVSTQHVGLHNLNQRVRLLYGDEYGLKLSPSQLGGLQVHLILPFLREEQKKLI